MIRPWLMPTAAALCASACATIPDVARPGAAPAWEDIAVSVGPCFGFCPVYEVRVSPDGAVSFEGQRHTAVLGTRHRDAGTEAYRSLARDLAPFRPASGTEAPVPCDAAISDTSSYTVTWTDAEGHKTVAQHRSGCIGGPGRELDAVLRGLPGRLGIADWSRQTTRPGTPRG